MSGHGFGQEPPEPVDPPVASGMDWNDPQAWLERAWVGRTVAAVDISRHGMTIAFTDGETFTVRSYNLEPNPLPLFVSNAKWGRVP